MGIESLIPFGLDTESGQLVDVGSVERGNACGCICPSCRTPLVARHGDEKEWHFAHRSQKVHNDTRKACEYSFAVSVRLMIRQLSNDGLKFRAPKLERTLSAFSEYSYQSAEFGYLVTEESLLMLSGVQVGAEFCGVTVDVLGFVEGVPFVIFVTYKERVLPSALKSPSVTKCGVVELDVNAVPGLFKQEAKGQYKEVLRRYIENETDGKAWVYHPREQRLREAAMARRQSWLLEQRNVARIPTGNSCHFSNQAGPQACRSVVEGHEPMERSIGNYICVMCKSTWTGTSRICKKCNTHLYTTENE